MASMPSALKSGVSHVELHRRSQPDVGVADLSIVRRHEAWQRRAPDAKAEVLGEVVLEVRPFERRLVVLGGPLLDDSLHDGGELLRQLHGELEAQPAVARGAPFARKAGPFRPHQVSDEVRLVLAGMDQSERAEAIKREPRALRFHQRRNRLVLGCNGHFLGQHRDRRERREKEPWQQAQQPNAVRCRARGGLR
jgi:hypothetical protein